MRRGQVSAASTEDIVLKKCNSMGLSFTMQVSALLKSKYPRAEVHQLGSTTNGLVLRDSNAIDICLEVPESEGESVTLSLQAHHLLQ